MKTLLIALKYSHHNWKICGDLKVVSLILGMQEGYTKYPCFLCGIAEQVTNTNDHLKKHSNLPPLHIKIGLMKNYVKNINKGNPAFAFTRQKFSQVSDAKLNASIFNGSQIRNLMKEEQVDRAMSETERAWQAFKSVVNNFLGNKRSS
ncbi:uncharacterized protein LOC143041732 [Oratosquilla oratoria]|uniref:uncharacterized protein LOC143041732 n=1 Tax=Oratosquilla oratoria TaxID=337810 RepID=UPI003F76D696